MNLLLDDVAATIAHLNTRTENAGADELDLAKDIDVIADVEAKEIQPLFNRDITKIFWTADGKPLFPHISRIPLDISLENHTVMIDDHMYTVNRLRKFSVVFRDGKRADLRFQFQLNPNPEQSCSLDFALITGDVRLSVQPRQTDLPIFDDEGTGIIDEELVLV